MKKILFSFSLIILFVFSVSAIYGSPSGSQNYDGNWSACIKSYINKTNDGFELVDVGDKDISIKKLNNDLKFISEKKLPI